MDKFLMEMVDRIVSLLVFLVLCQSVNGQNDHCQATSCITCFFPPSCVVTPLSEYSYNYICQASSLCQSSPVPDKSYGYFCFVSLSIMEGNAVTFLSGRLSYPKDTCSTGTIVYNCSSDIVMEVSSFNVTNYVQCSCFEENCQRMKINATLFIDPPNDDPPDDEDNASSSLNVINEMTSSIEPSLTMIPSISPTIINSMPSLTNTAPAPSITLTSLRSHSFGQSTRTITSFTGSTTSLTSIEHSSTRITSSILQFASSVVSIPQSTSSLTSVSTRSSTESVLVPSSTVTSTAAVTIGLASGISVFAFIIALIAVVIIFILAFSWRKHSPKFHRCSHQVQFFDESSIVIELEPEPGPPSFQLIQSISNGKFGSVWKALYETETVAVRVFTQRHKTSWQNERDIYLLDSTPHENILKFISSESHCRGSSSEYFILTEYLPLGSLHQFLHHNTLSWEQAWNIMYSITSGITHLHSDSYYSNGLLADKYSIAHRDIKPSNILLKSVSGQCVVADFGQAFVLDPANDDRKLAVSGQVGTYRYMSPEALDARVNLRDIESFKQIDVYALALVLWEVCMRYQFDDVPVPPYQSPFFDSVGEKPTLEQMKEIVVINKQRPLVPEKWHNDKNLKAIIKPIVEGWDEDPEARLTAANIKIQLENLVGMRPKPPPSSTSQPDGRKNFLSPIFESSESSCKKYRLSASFSESSGNAVIYSNPSSKLSGRFSVDHASNTLSHNTILNDLRRYRDRIGVSNNFSTTATTNDSTQPNRASTLGGSSDEVSSSESQDGVSVIDTSTGQPKNH